MYKKNNTTWKIISWTGLVLVIILFAKTYFQQDSVFIQQKFSNITFIEKEHGNMKKAKHLIIQTRNVSTSKLKEPSFEQQLLNTFTQKLKLLRKEFLSKGYLTKKGITKVSTKPDKCEAKRPEFFYKLYKKHSFVKTLILFLPKGRFKSVHQQQMTSVDRVPMSVSRIFPTYLDPGVCADMKRKSASLLLGTCAQLSDVRVTENPFSRYRALYNSYSAVYVHVVPDAAVEDMGDVRARGVQIAPLNCGAGGGTASKPDFSHCDTWRTYPEVFTIARYWSQWFWHFSVESFPRIFPYVQFLKNNPSVRVHVWRNDVGYVKLAFRLVGISTARLVTGPLRARVAYVPQGGGCLVRINPFAVQGLAGIYHDYITNTLHGNWEKKTIILIQRTKNRRLLQHGQIAAILRDEARKRNLDFIIFSDAHYPPIDYVLRSFQRAALIVAPHGAGLSNMIYTRPPASVIEVMCYNKKKVHCYPILSQTLGHRHFAIKATSGCNVGMTLDLKKLERLIKIILGSYAL